MMIWSSITMELHLTAATNPVQVLTLSSFCSSVRSFGTQCAVQFHMQDVIHCSKGDPMGSGKFLAGSTAVSLDIGGGGGNNAQGSLCLLRIQVPLVISVFPSLNFVGDLVNCTF
jgi:hypothetical protein